MKEGWHKDPDNPGEERWWDGEDWGPTRKISRNIQEAGRRSSRKDMRPRRRRQANSSSGNSPKISSGESSSEAGRSPDPEPPSFSGKNDQRSSQEPSFVELPSAKEGSPRGRDFHEEDDIWVERKAESNDFQDLEELSAGSVSFESFEEIAREELPEAEAPSKKKKGPRKKSPTPKAPGINALRSFQEKVTQKKKHKETAKKLEKEPSSPEPQEKKSRRQEKKKRSSRLSSKSPGATAAKKMLPVGVGIIVVVAAAAILPGALEGDPAPPKTLQDRLDTQLAEKRKKNRKPYPGIERCLRENSSVNSVLQRPNKAGELEWKAIFIDSSKNYQIITVIRKPSPGDAQQSARLTASTFITTSSGPYYIQGPVKGIGSTGSNKQLSSYVAKLADCIAKT